MTKDNIFIFILICLGCVGIGILAGVLVGTENYTVTCPSSYSCPEPNCNCNCSNSDCPDCFQLVTDEIVEMQNNEEKLKQVLN